jgi:hypothetical protein
MMEVSILLRLMDFSKEQIKTLQTVVGQVVDDKIRINNDILIQEIRASEYRIEKKFDQKLKVQKDEILEAVGDMLGGSIVPQLDNHEQRLTKLEAKTV